MKQATHRPVRGFTLVELMVAMTGAIFISVVVFSLSRDVTRFFQNQSRVSESTGAVINGFERLRTDIQRAGFLASPNIAKDINRCPRPPTGGSLPGQGGISATAPGSRNVALADIRADTNTAVTANPQMTLNSLAPDVITMWGNYTSTDEFAVRSFNEGSLTLFLEPESPAMIREGMITANGDATNTPILQRIFPAGTLVRVADGTGRDQYALVASASWTTLVPQVVLTNTIPLLSKATNAFCGLRGSSTDLAVNPVNIVRYQLDSLELNTAYDNLREGARTAYDSERLELVRRELDPTDFTATPLNEELIAEYAVDLRFGLTVLTGPTAGTLTYLPETSAARINYAGDPHSAAEAGNLGPHLIRGIHARLMVRNRVADREMGIMPAATPADQLFRVQVVAGQFARTRSLRSHIATRNTKNSMWN